MKLWKSHTGPFTLVTSQPKFKGRGHKPPTCQWEECEKHIVRRTYRMGDIVLAILENTVCRRDYL